MKVRFYIEEAEEVVDIDDDATDEEIQEYYDMWFNGNAEGSWNVEESEE